MSLLPNCTWYIISDRGLYCLFGEIQYCLKDNKTLRETGGGEWLKGKQNCSLELQAKIAIVL